MGPIATAALGLGTGTIDNATSQIWGEIAQKRQLRGLDKSLQIQNKHAMEMWEKTGYGATKEQMQKAGLNPALLYGMGSPGGQTTGGSGSIPQETGSKGMDIMSAAQLALLNSQRKNIDADTADKMANIPVKEKTVPKIESETANNILEGIVKKYGGLEAERQWNINNELTTEEYGAKANELEARKATATNIIRLWEDGTMKKMSDAELNNKLKEIGVKEGTIKKLELENALTEMEKKLQETIGIGRDSKGWLDMGIKLILSLLRK